MKTWQAILAHLGIGALQALVGANVSGGVLANPALQIGAQTGLLLLQGWVAQKNSTTDPQGKPLAPSASGGFVTSTK